MSQIKRNIDYVSIEFEGNYFNTKEQISIKQNRKFVDTSNASRLSGSNEALGFFTRKTPVKDKTVYNSSVYPTSSVVVDASGAPRPILSLNIDFFTSASVDAFKNGIEITQEKHWTAGVAKITAGTPGHLVDNTFFGGGTPPPILSPDVYYEIEVFNPIKYVETGGQLYDFTYPIITSDVNQAENYILDGIIEPLTIRAVISNFSINFPFEPHSIKGNVDGGNLGKLSESDQVLSVDYYLPNRINKTPFLDCGELIGLFDENNGVYTGQSIGYFITDQNDLGTFEDRTYLRGEETSSTYTNDLIEALQRMSGSVQGTTYMNNRQKSATCGFVYNNSYSGTDSIAYGGLLY